MDPSPGCRAFTLPDGRAYEVDCVHWDVSPDVLAKAAELAWDRAGGTHPLSSYDIDMAHEIITGEVNEIARLQRELATAHAMIRRLTTPSHRAGQQGE